MKLPEITVNKPSEENVNPVQFIKQSITELKKVTWPSRQQTLKLTFIVITVSTAVGFYIGALDYLFTKLMEFILK